MAKTTLTSPVVPGEPVSYTIVAANAGSSTVTDAAVADTFAAPLLNCTYTAAATAGTPTGFTPSGSGDIADTLTLAPGDQVTYTVTCDVDPAATGTVDNTATIASAAVPDPVPANNTSTVSDPLSPSADLSVVKTTLTSPVEPGQPVSYSVVVTNLGPSTVTDAAVADSFVVPLLSCTYTAAATAGTPSGFTPSGAGDISDTLSLAPGDEVTYTIVCGVDAAATGLVTNTATVNSTVVPDPDTANNTSTVLDALSPSADLSVVKTTLTSPVVSGEPVSYTIVVGNGGPASVPDALVSDTFAVPLLNCTYTATATAGTPSGFTPSGSGDIADTLTLAPGDAVTYTVTCDVDPAATDTVDNTATVSSPTVPDVVPANNTSTVSDPLSPSADLSVVKTTLTSPVVPGEPVSYTIVAANAGSSTVTDAAVADTFAIPLLNCTYTAAATAGAPSGFTPSGSGNIADTPTLAPGEQVTYTVTCDVDPAATGTVGNTATIASAAVPDPVPDNNTSTVTDPLLAEADLNLAKNVSLTTDADGSGAISAGDTVTFTLTLNNLGPSDATGIEVMDLLPSGYAYATDDGGGAYASGSGVWTVGDLAAGGTAVLHITAVVQPSGAFDNFTEVSAASTPDPNSTPGNDGGARTPDEDDEAVVTPQIQPTAVDDTSLGNTTGTVASVPILTNDFDPDGTLVPATVDLVPPAGATGIVTDGDGDVIGFTVPNEGTWSWDASLGVLTFTPAATFTGDPTPIQYTVADDDGNRTLPALVTVGYNQLPPVAVDDNSPDNPPGSSVLVDVLANDSDPNNDIDPATVVIVNPPAGSTLSIDGKTLQVPGEGTWTVDPATGAIRFTPVASFTGDPTPIQYTVTDNTGLVSAPATVTVGYPPLAQDDFRSGLTLTKPAAINVVANDLGGDTAVPSTVNLDPSSVPGGVGFDGDGDGDINRVVVPGEGVWTVNALGVVRFAPEAGFLGDPTPISYTVEDDEGVSSNPATVTLIYEDLGSITGTIWLDNSDDGIMDSGEPGIYGVTVDLIGAGPDGVLGTADDVVVASASTGANGGYAFLGVFPGDYRVEVTDRGPDGIAGSGDEVLRGLVLAPGQTDLHTLVVGDGETVENVNTGYVFDIPTTRFLLTDVGAYVDGGSVVVRWETSSEGGTVGFYLYRWDESLDDYVEVSESLVPANAGAPQGSIYQLRDPTAPLQSRLTYAIVEVESGGGEKVYGPFEVDTAWKAPGLRLDTAMRAEALQPNASERLVAASAETSATQVAGFGVGTGPAALGSVSRKLGSLKAAVPADGIYTVSLAQIAAAAGIDTEQARAAMNQGRLQVTSNGRQLAWEALASGSGIRFYAQVGDDPFSERAVVWVGLGSGSTMARTSGGRPAGSAQPTPSWATVHAEQDLLPLLAAGPEDDFWFWATVTADVPGYDTAVLPVNLPGAVSSRWSSLTVQLTGLTSFGTTFDHRARVSINGVQIGSTSWSGERNHRVTISVPSGVLHAGANTVRIVGERPSGVIYSAFAVDSVEVKYLRRHVAVNDRIELTAGNRPVVTVTGLGGTDVVVYDITDPLQPSRIVGLTVQPAGSGYSVSWVPTTPDSRYRVERWSRIGRLSDASVRADSGLAGPAVGAEYVVITPSALRSGANALADHRTSAGMSVRVVELEEIYDAFSNGHPTPRAVQSFLRHAYGNWSVRPRFAVLIGAGTYDYKNRSGRGGNLLPPLLASTPWGRFASDTMLGDVVGDDGAPEISVGRIPALSNTELIAYVDKMAASESVSIARGVDHVVMVADGNDSVGTFSTDSDRIAALAPATAGIEKIYVSRKGLARARTELQAALSSGRAWINYLGHGGLSQLSSDGLLTVQDVDGLATTTRLPVVAALTCSTGRFEIPGFESLGERLVMAPDRGAAAVWSASGQAIHPDSVKMNEALFAAVFSSQHETIGEAIVEALNDYSRGGHFRFILQIYNLIGDPAYRIR